MNIEEIYGKETLEEIAETGESVDVLRSVFELQTSIQRSIKVLFGDQGEKDLLRLQRKMRREEKEFVSSVKKRLNLKLQEVDSFYLVDSTNKLKELHKYCANDVAKWCMVGEVFAQLEAKRFGIVQLLNIFEFHSSFAEEVDFRMFLDQVLDTITFMEGGRMESVLEAFGRIVEMASGDLDSVLFCTEILKSYDMNFGPYRTKGGFKKLEYFLENQESIKSKFSDEVILMVFKSSLFDSQIKVFLQSMEDNSIYELDKIEVLLNNLNYLELLIQYKSQVNLADYAEVFDRLLRSKGHSIYDRWGEDVSLYDFLKETNSPNVNTSAVFKQFNALTDKPNSVRSVFNN